jgi:hypothetical protein
MYCWCKNKKYISKGKAFPVFLLLLFGKVSISLYFCTLKIESTKMKSILRILLLLLCLMIGRVGYGQEVWELVTDYDNLSTTDTYVIAGNSMYNLDKWWTMKNDEIAKDNFPQTGSLLSISGNRIISTVSIHETWKIERTEVQDLFYIKSTKGNYYLQLSTSTKCKITSKPTGDNIYKAQWRIHYEDSYDDGSTIYTSVGLFNNGATPRKILSIYEGTNSIEWHAETPQNYKWQANQEVVLFRKVTDVNASITSAEYATFSSPDALDFSAESGLTVYTASVNADKMEVTLHEVPSKKVPANTAVMLHGSQGSYKGSIVASAEDLGSNDLKVANSDMNGEAGNIYVLNIVEGVVGFYKLKATGTLKAGKAYIVVPGGSGAPMLSLQDGELTGLSPEKNGMEVNKLIYYTLDGQRVMHPSKGVFILNGKKVVIK